LIQRLADEARAKEESDKKAKMLAQEAQSRKEKEMEEANRIEQEEAKALAQ